MKLSQFSFFGLIALVVLCYATISLAANNGGKGQLGTVTPPPTPKPQPKPSLVPITPPTPVPSSTPVPSATPVPSTPPATPSVQPIPEEVAVDYIQVERIEVFANMENAFQVTNYGSAKGSLAYRWVVTDTQGVVASALTSHEAEINGETVDSRSAYPAMRVRFKLNYLREGAPASGNGTLTVCLADNPEDHQKPANCVNTSTMGVGSNDGGERATSYSGPVYYSLSSASPSGLGLAGSSRVFSVQGDNISLSFSHPVYGALAPGKFFKDYQSPLVLDLTDKGFALLDVWDDTHKVKFDLRGEGKKIRTGWIKPGAGLLVLDETGKGEINSGRELFGEYSKIKDQLSYEPFKKSFENGFAALAQYLPLGATKLTKADSIWSKLKVWEDSNIDGVAQPGELKALNSYGIVEISLAYTEEGSKEKPITVARNEIRYMGTYKTKDGKIHKIADVWFKQRRNEDKVPEAKLAEEKRRK